jgi:DNA (cytosine-5)-methyltransferase 1
VAAVSQLVLSLFPGIGLLDMAFEEEGFCVVRGPDLLWGGDVRRFHPPAGKFDGVIGGPPCQSFSQAAIGVRPVHGDLIPEFVRVLLEARPAWWVMENVPQAPWPPGACTSRVLDAVDFGAAQWRKRRWSSNLPLRLAPVAFKHPDPWPTVTATEFKYTGRPSDQRRAGRKVGRTMTLAEVNGAMGLPSDFETPALLREWSYRVRGNGVPLPMGRAIARAVKAALGIDQEVSA